MVQLTDPSSGRAPRPLAFACAALVALALAVAAVFAVSGPATAASGTKATSGHAALTLTGSAGKRLSSAGVKVKAGGRASIRKATVTVPVAVSVVGDAAAVGLNGTVAFTAGKRSVKLTGLRVMVSKSRKVQILARAGGDQFAFLTGTVAKKALTLDRFSSTAAFTATSLTFTKGAASLLKKKLKLRRTPSGSIGKLTLVAPGTTGPGTTTGGTTGTTTGGTTTGGTTTGGTTTDGTTTSTTPAGPGPKVCTPTTPATNAVSESGWDVAPPAGSVNVSNACITFHPRDSWIDYINSNAGLPAWPNDGATLTNNVTAEAPNTACGALLARDFHFQFHRGWYDPVTGQVGLQYDGTMRFRFEEHGIDLSFQSPELHLGGATADATLRSGGSRASTFDINQTGPRSKICTVDPGPKNSHDPTGIRGIRTYERLAATLSDSGAALFANSKADFYPPGDRDFGWFSVAFTPGSTPAS